MSRTDMLQKLHALTTGDTQATAMGLVFDYLCDYDPVIVIGLNSVLGRVSQTPALITVPTATLTRANLSSGSNDRGYVQSTL